MRRSAVVAVGLTAIFAVILTAAVAASIGHGDGASYVLKDVASLCTKTVTSLGPHAGAISALGIMIWTAAAAAGLLSGWVLLRRPAQPRQQAWLMLTLGIASAFAALDDQYQVHERIMPAAGLPQGLYSIMYAGSILAILVVFRRLLVQHDTVLLAIALGMLGMSVVCDMAADYVDWEGSFETIAEDAFKFLGVGMWAAFVFRNALWRIESAFAVTPVLAAQG